jgi:hypothetical protein
VGNGEGGEGVNSVGVSRLARGMNGSVLGGVGEGQLERCKLTHLWPGSSGVLPSFTLDARE